MPSTSAVIAANLRLRATNISAELAAMNPTAAGGLPDYSGSGGVQHVQYRKSLMDELDSIMARLSAMGDPDLVEAGEGAGYSERYVDI